MKRIPALRIPLFALLLSGMAVAAIGQTQFATLLGENEFLKKLRETFASFMDEHPEDRVYLHFDKPFYKPGESIWFQTYVRNGADMKPSAKSGIVNIEFISPKGTKAQEFSLVLEKGTATGEIALSEDMAGGLYKVRAYTNWQRNYQTEGNDGIFEKEIQVQQVVLPRLKMQLDFARKSYDKGETATANLQLESLQNTPLAGQEFSYVASIGGKPLKQGTLKADAEGKADIAVELPKRIDSEDALLNVMIPYNGQTESISRAIPLLFKDIHLELFPEGGDLVDGLPTRVAFRARKKDAEGKPAEVSGRLLNGSGEVVTTFSSYHDGMGAFSFTPEHMGFYEVEITSPKGVEKIFELPRVLEAGYSLNIKGLPTQKLTLEVNSTERETLSLIAQMRGQVYWTEAIEMRGKGKAQLLEVPISELPMGVLQITLFDSKGIERAERLAFLHRDRRLDIDIQTDKSNYQPREQVKLTITAKDSRGVPMPAQLSLSVTDDKIISFADDKQGHILSKLLLEPDLNAKVHEPNFYFDENEEKSLQALDYLMMTSGWRRFTWETIREGDMAMNYPAEQAVITGQVLRESGEPARQMELKINGGEWLDGKPLKTIQTNDLGEYRIEKLVLTETVTLSVNHEESGESGSVTITEYGGAAAIRMEKPRPIWQEKMVFGAAPDDAWGADEVQEVAAAAPRQAMARKQDRKQRQAVQQRMEMQELVKREMQEAKKALPPPAPEENVRDKDENPFGDVAEAEIADGFGGNVNFEDIDMGGGFGDEVEEDPAANEAASTRYRRAREFPAPDYADAQKPKMRTDFRETIFWKGNLELDRTGKAEVRFYNSDAVTAFRVTVEGIGGDGTVGRAEEVYYTLLPFSAEVKVPAEVTMGDEIHLPLALTNNTAEELTIDIDYHMPEAFERMSRFPSWQTVRAHQTQTVYLKVKVQNQPCDDTVRFSFRSRSNPDLLDAFEQPIFIGRKGFPVDLAISGQKLDHAANIPVTNPVEATLSATFTAYPTVLSDMLAGIESILREPYGCFEQTSSSTYPNILVMNYLEAVEEDRPEVREKAMALIKKGYNRLVSYETSEKGYEWFGGTPAHEALTAYGLMEFRDMAKVFDGVSADMVDRTAKYLMGRRDGKGGFERNQKALDSYGRASEEITNAYIVYALSEAGYVREIEKELERALQTAKKMDDPYQLALVANALFNVKDQRSQATLQTLLAKQKEDGSWEGQSHSITYSQGKALTVETTSLALMALLKSDETNPQAVKPAADFLISARSPYGGFGNTQSTVMALRALTAFAKWAKQTPSSGDIELHINGKIAANGHYDQGQKGEIMLSGLEEHLTSGDNKLHIRFKNTKEALPYTARISYSTLQPPSSDACKVAIRTKMAKSQISMGETVRLDIALENTTQQGQPMTLAVVGIPGGLSAQPWQLKEHQENGVFDFYEIRGNTLALYYRQMKPGETKNIALDLKADIPGQYEAPASRAYLYYTSEHKHWVSGQTIQIKE